MIDISTKLRGLAVFAAAALVGCASGVYRIPAAEGKDTADLAFLEQPLDPDVGVSAIDGRLRPWGIINKYEITPGPHRITVQLIRGGTTVVSDPLELNISAERGVSYLLQSRVSPSASGGGRWSAWIINKQTGLTVSSPVAK